MPVATITTPGAADANSYLTVAEARARYSVDPFAGDAPADDDTLARCLIAATRRLEPVPWAGWRTYAAQSLAWPRSNVWDEDRNLWRSPYDVPEEVKAATAALALVYGRAVVAGTNPATPDALAAFSSLSIPGVVSFDLAPGRATDGDTLPPAVVRLIGRLSLGDGTDVIRV